MKKIIVSLIAVSMILPVMVYADENIYYVNDKGIEMTEREYNNLLNCGFKDIEIKYMNLSTFNENKDYDDAFVEVETHVYYKTVYDQTTDSVIYNQEITKEEFDNAPLNCRGDGLVQTSYKELTNSIVNLNINTKRFRTTLQWLNLPNVRSFDIIGSGFSNTDIYVFSGAPSLDIVYCYSDGSCTTQLAGYYYSVTDNGSGASFQLPTDQIISLYSTLYYSVAKDTNNTITYLRSCGDYSHAITTVTGAQSVLYNLGYDGLYLNANIIDYYDAMNCAVATWSGSW